jgi:hypothetical protein
MIDEDKKSDKASNAGGSNKGSSMTAATGSSLRINAAASKLDVSDPKNVDRMVNILNNPKTPVTAEMKLVLRSLIELSNIPLGVPLYFIDFES